jgi:hypothetical protein
VAPGTAFHESVTEVLVTKLPDTGPVLAVQPGGVGGGGGGFVPPFLLQELITTATSSKLTILFL